MYFVVDIGFDLVFVSAITSVQFVVQTITIGYDQKPTFDILGSIWGQQQ